MLVTRSSWLVLVLAAPAAALVAPAVAQTPCGNTGADVIVATIGSVANFTANTLVDAAMFGETTCNLGTATVTCTSTTNQHPIHAQGLFRYEVVGGAGRFEQVGMSWCSHDFFELEANVCCTCSSVGNGNLGPGCSTVSTASSQANQANLGKRYDVNALTGFFAYPLSLPTTTSAQARRLQFIVNDVDPATHAGASFFAEAAVIAPDDATAQNGANNASHRPVNVAVSAGDAVISLSGTTVREQAAIWAWKTIDPQVDVEVVQLPMEGVLLVASRATDLGGGLWHYEYAVENLNSDASCGAFHVPLAGGTLPAAVGFHDVNYHSGDGLPGMPIDPTDWSATIGASGIAWSTVPWSASPVGNGLRFATLYNFRFDATVAPQIGAVTLDLWKTPGTANANAWVPGTATQPGTPFCFGDGSGTPCPCANDSAPGADEGCLNSLGTGGKLVTFGQSSVANDTLVLSGTRMASSSCLYFQGTSQLLGGAGIVFGDGLRCSGGSVIRLGIHTNVAGASHYPMPGDQPISVRGACAPGNVRTYQVWYRNSAPFCSPSTFNLTNGVQVTWS
jgi:hypothetical protein